MKGLQPMLDQNFSAKNFLKLTTKADPRKLNLGRRKGDYKRTLEIISNEIHLESYAFTNQHKIASNGDDIYKTINRTDIFALRKLSDNLARLHDAKQASRQEIVEQVSNLLAETTPYFIVKLDILKFYNNVDAAAVIRAIKDDPRPSYHTKRVLELLTKTQAFTDTSGLPRGLGVSATLSEIALKEFDRKVRRIEGVYYYARYVDDMILFIFKSPQDVIDTIKTILPPPLQLNGTKEKIIRHDGKIFSCDTGSPNFDYLGYTFVGRQSNIGPRISIRIADKKIQKLKRKIMLSLHDLIKSADLDLCIHRLKFLTANIAMKSSAKYGQLYSGIYYNYPKADPEIIKEQLKELDTFTRKALFSARGSIGKGLTRSVTRGDRIRLARNSFLKGYERKIKYDFNRERLIAIARCWK